MIDRRNFIKKTVVAGIAVGIGNPSLSSAINTIKSNSNIVKLDHTGFIWDKTIFCQFDNQELQKRIERCAKEIDCKVYYGEPDSSDIIAVPCFVSIVDRNIVGEDGWREYINYCKEAEYIATCIIVDKNDFHDEFELPDNKYFCQYYETKSDSILDMVKKIKKENDSHNCREGRC